MIKWSIKNCKILFRERKNNFGGTFLMNKIINRKILILVSLLIFLPLFVGCFGAPPTNQSPTITSTPITTAIVDVLYTYDVEATDPDSGDTSLF